MRLFILLVSFSNSFHFAPFIEILLLSLESKYPTNSTVILVYTPILNDICCIL